MPAILPNRTFTHQSPTQSWQGDFVALTLCLILLFWLATPDV